MKKQISLVLAALLSCTLLLSACSGGGGAASSQEPAGESASQAGEEAPSEEPAGGGEAVELGFLDVMPSPERTEFLKSQLDKFHEQNPNVTFTYNSVPWDDAYKKVVSMAASNTLPDILTGDVTFMLALAPMGQIEDLTEMWEGSPDYGDLSEATKAASSLYTYEDKVYAIPDGYQTQGIFVRTDWLEAAGYKVEDLQNWNWDQYFEVVEKLTDPTQNRYGIAFRGGGNGFMRFYEYLASELETPAIFPGDNDTTILEDPRAQELFEKFYGLYKNGQAPKDSVNWAFKEMVEGFINGQCGTLNQTPEVTITCEQSMEDGTWTVLPFPSKEGAQKKVLLWGQTAGYMVSANCKDKEAGFDFIRYISSPEVNLEYCKAFSGLPLYKSTLNDDFFQKGAMKGYADALLADNLAYLTQPTELTQWGYFLSEYAKNETQKYMTGAQDSATTIANLNSWLKENYAKDIAGK